MEKSCLFRLPPAFPSSLTPSNSFHKRNIGSPNTDDAIFVRHDSHSMFPVPDASKLETYVREAVFGDIQNMNGSKADQIPKAIASNRAEVFRRFPLVKPIPFGQRTVVIPNRFQDIGRDPLFVVFEGVLAQNDVDTFR